MDCMILRCRENEELIRVRYDAAMKKERAHHEKELAAMQSDALYSLSINALMSAIAASIVAWTYWGSASTQVLLLWLALDYSHATTWMILHVLRRRPGGSGLEQTTWRSIYVGLLVVGGLIWGSSGLLFVPAGSPEQAMLGGLIAMGAVLATYPTVIYPRAFLAFQVPVFCLCAVGFVTSGLAYGSVAAAMSVAVSIALIQIGQQMGDRLTSAMRLTIENAEMMRHQTEQSIALAQANKDLERLSQIDPLTGIANRRRLIEALRSDGREVGAALLYIDVDHFKQFNDSFGHGAGDECLIAVAKVLSRHAGLYDGLAARQGGEEFSLLFPRISKEHAAQIAEEVRIDIETIHSAGGRIARPVTVSIGYAYRAPRMNDDQFMDQADAAAYRAKRGGRNQVCGPDDTGEIDAFRKALA